MTSEERLILLRKILFKRSIKTSKQLLKEKSEYEKSNDVPFKSYIEKSLVNKMTNTSSIIRQYSVKDLED